MGSWHPRPRSSLAGVVAGYAHAVRGLINGWHSATGDRQRGTDDSLTETLSVRLAEAMSGGSQLDPVAG